MAQKVTVILTDDLSGEEATRTVQFGIHGKQYEIDLTDKHADELDAALEKFIKAGRTVGNASTGRSRRSTSTKNNGPDPARVRKWAAMNSIEVNPRGRIPKEIIERYEAANGKPVEAPKPAESSQKPAQAAEKPKEQAKPAEAPKSPQKGAQTTKSTAEKVAKEEEKKGTQKPASK